MSKDNDNIDINLHLSKDRFKTQVTLFIGLVIIYILSQNRIMHIVCILLGVIDIIELCMSAKNSNKEEEKPTEEKAEEGKPKEKERVRVKVAPEPAVTDNESTKVDEEPVKKPEANTMTESDWADFFASLDEGK